MSIGSEWVQALLLAFDLLGTFVFALSGGLLAVRKRLDLFGVLVLSCAAAVSGGIVRDVLIGAHPPASLADWRYLVTAMLAGLATFRWHAHIERLRNPVQLFDAAGLALFAVLGTGKALAFGLSPFAAMLLGMVTGIGGGIARDVLVARIPVVLQAELYAVAALVGGAIVALAAIFNLPQHPAMVLGALACFGLRYFALRRGWRLPVAGG
ncbi:MAG: trimeric intracellular cation channel family protein [Thermomonas sp.]|uniref:trimeric intracellular cation channel family protein n=1 Tax=Thermomonas sp. TaxID=1971895 RepID=UPI001EB5276C|nr:trimeric intracellular cation channel family protein [Thermomonas sp.]MBV2208979.1 trimeric intracellular cation channel family protein [Thermomonas sp.]